MLIRGFNMNTWKGKRHDGIHGTAVSLVNVSKFCRMATAEPVIVSMLDYTLYILARFLS